MYNEAKNLPVFKKAMEILELIRGLEPLIEESEEITIKSQLEFLMSDAMIIPAKIAGAEGGDLYDIRMENAAIIRKAAKDLYVNVGSFEYYGLKDVDYIHLIREKINEFKLIFRDWVKSFDKWNYTIDDWGLFNPPGVEPGDEG